MKHYILTVQVRSKIENASERKRYLVSVRKGVEVKKYALTLALGVICGAERSPFMPFAWSSEKVRTRKKKPDLGRPWIERDEFEVRRFENLKVSLLPRGKP